MERILIAGCGYVGTRLGLHLKNEGYQVYALRRDAKKIPKELSPFPADLNLPSSLEDLPKVDSVFYTAAANNGSAEAYQMAYVDGLRNLLAYLKPSPKHFIYLSSTRVYGEHNGAWVDEETTPAPMDEQAQLLLAGEELVRKAKHAGYILRLGGIYGPGRDFLMRHIQNNHESISASDQTFTNRIHIDDIIAICAGFLKGSFSPGIYLGVDSEPTNQAELYGWLAQKLHVSPPQITSGASPGPQRGNKKCSNKKLKDAGYRFRYPRFRDGYSALLKDFSP